MYKKHLNPLLHFNRDDGSETNHVKIDPRYQGPAVPKTIIGSFLEHFMHAPSNGVHAQQLINPTFQREPNLTQKQVDELLTNGQLLVKLYLSGGDAAVLKPRWSYSPYESGFSVGVLDEPAGSGLPFGWAPLGYPGSATASLGRLGGAVRLHGGRWPMDPQQYWPVLEDGPAGVRQGVFLPVRRCLAYHGSLWARIGANDPLARGEVEVGFRRRVATPDGRFPAGECLAKARLAVRGEEWANLQFTLQLEPGQVNFGEPIDFYIRWIPGSDPALHLLLDRAVLYPDDAVDGLDPEVIQVSRDWPVPLLRWPGGNYVSYYHWRDGVGPAELRPTRANLAWGGLDYNLFGTDEYMRFCQLIGAEPHITVNTGTGTSEEAAAWVEYCNGDESTPMGKLRSQNGHPEPYTVHYWEIGNELFGSWQGGNHGADENARRCRLFAEAMRAASPTPIELIACGNGFDFAVPGPGYDIVHADRRWHDQILKQAAGQIDYISLHSMPVNDLFLENVSDEQAHNAVMAQVYTWENRFLPDLLERCDRATQGMGKTISLAISEWGAVGSHPNRLNVENFGAVVYVGAFLNMMIRNAGRIPIANTTGFMHGGCIRRAYGITYYDPQYLAVHQYAQFAGTIPLRVELTGPGYDTNVHADVGAVEEDVPFVDVVACQAGEGLLMAATNKHLSKPMTVEIEIPEHRVAGKIEMTLLTYADITARTNPVQPDRFPFQHQTLAVQGGKVTLTIPPFSVCWLTL